MSDAVLNPAQRSLVTPEGVDLKLQIASAGERAAAFLIDFAIIVAVLTVFTIALLLAAWGTEFEALEAIGVVWLLGFFLLRNFYFAGFELRPRAATPGKRALGLRVAARNGGRLGAEAVFGRNVMRELEVFLPITFLFARQDQVDAWIALAGLLWTGVFVLFPVFNRDKLRVGDLVAGTWVVRAPKRKLTLDMAEQGQAVSGDFAFTTAQLDAYGVKELQVLEDVLRRRERATLKAVADRIRAKIRWDGPWAPDADFLSAYYAALRGRLEQRLLFGRRKKDKHDVG